MNQATIEYPRRISILLIDSQIILDLEDYSANQSKFLAQ